MNRYQLPLLAIAVALAPLAACEGEPPKVPVATTTAPSGHAAEPVAEEALAPADAAPPPAASADAATAANTPAPCVAPDGGAEGGVVAAAPAEPAQPVLGNIIGKITSTPARAAATSVIYLEDAPIDPAKKLVARVDNKAMNFIPYIQVVTVGGKVTFSNSDPFPHNVFSPDGERFDLGNIAQGSASARTFKKTGAYSLLCNLHPGMLGYVVVVPSTYYAKADGTGSYKIANVPAGTYKITAWAPRLPTSTQSVTVKEGDTSVDFELHR